MPYPEETSRLDTEYSPIAASFTFEGAPLFPLTRHAMGILKYPYMHSILISNEAWFYLCTVGSLAGTSD